MQTNYKYLKENNLYEAHKAFMRMCEGYGYAPIEEEGDMEQGGGMPDPNGGGMPDPNAGGMGSDQGLPDVPDINDAEPQEEEDVIDVDQLTKAQQKIFDRVNNVGMDLGKTDRRIDNLLGAIEKMQGMIDRSNSQIEDLKREFEKRNPTQTEKLNMRSLTSGPFNVSPNDYWEKKELEGRYSPVGDDNDEDDEYTITKDDINNMSDTDIKNSFVPDDLRQDINKIFGIGK